LESIPIPTAQIRKVRKEIGKYRILRGGSWSDPAEYLRSAMRRDALPTSTYNNVGFRCAANK